MGGRLLLPLVRLKVFAWEAALHSPSNSRLALRAERFRAAPPREGWPKGTRPQRLLTVRLLEGDPNAFLHLTTYLRDRLVLPSNSGDAFITSLPLRAILNCTGPTSVSTRTSSRSRQARFNS